MHWIRYGINVDWSGSGYSTRPLDPTANWYKSVYFRPDFVRRGLSEAYWRAGFIVASFDAAGDADTLANPAKSNDSDVHMMGIQRPSMNGWTVRELYAGRAQDRFTPPGAMKLLRVFNRKTPSSLERCATVNAFRLSAEHFREYFGSFQLNSLKVTASRTRHVTLKSSRGASIRVISDDRRWIHVSTEWDSFIWLTRMLQKRGIFIRSRAIFQTMFIWSWPLRWDLPAKLCLKSERNGFEDLYDWWCDYVFWPSQQRPWFDYSTADYLWRVGVA